MKYLAAIVLGLLLNHASIAAPRDWTGSSDGSWSTATNWGGTAPVAGDDLVFASAANANALSNDFAVGSSFGSLAFDNDDALFRVGGNGIVLERGIANSGATVELRLPLSLGAPQTWSTTSIGALVLTPSAPVALGAHTLTIAGSGIVLFSGNSVSGSGGVVLEGTATLTLSHGTYGYTGSTRVGGAARLELFTTNPVATPIVIENGGTLFSFPLNAQASGVLDAPLSIHPGGTYQVVIDGTAIDQYTHLRVNAAPITLGGNLHVTNLAANPPGSIYTIIANATVSPITGTFAGLPEGAQLDAGGHTFRVSYRGGSGRDVTLTALPAPAQVAAATSIPALSPWMAALLALLLGAIGARRSWKKA